MLDTLADVVWDKKKSYPFVSLFLMPMRKRVILVIFFVLCSLLICVLLMEMFRPLKVA